LSESRYPVRRNEILDIEISNIAFGGKGIGYRGSYVVFVGDTIPGDLVRARITRRKQNYAEARLVEIIRPSDIRIKAPCPYFQWCGGCTWQNLSYQHQLNFKRQHVTETLEHIGIVGDVYVEKTIPSPMIWGYRNKMEFSFSDRRWLLPSELGNMEIPISYVLGLHVPGTFDKILDVDHCLLQSETANRILKITDDYCREEKLEPYGVRSHRGFMRFLVIRESQTASELMVNLVTAFYDPEKLQPLAERIITRVREVTGVVNNINTRKAQIAFGEKEYILSGKPYITENIGDLHFEISANSFFQTNTRQAQKLYEIAADFADLKGNEIVWDLYAGTGTISLFVAKRAKIVYGFELVESAVKDAGQNANENGIANVRFIAGDLLTNIRTFGPPPDVVIVDPPRSGMHPGVCSSLCDSGAERIVYVSCNPGTMARDVRLMNGHYRIRKVQPVDMFPHTYHVESVVLLERIHA
jgi:23S rRNA (uracil1939-C5)-methyltransferase